MDRELLQHIVNASSQYDETCRELASDLLSALARLDLLKEQNAGLGMRVRRAEERLKQLEPEPGKSSWVARADYDAAEERAQDERRCRLANEQELRRVDAMIGELRAKLATAERERDEAEQRAKNNAAAASIAMDLLSAAEDVIDELRSGVRIERVSPDMTCGSAPSPMEIHKILSGYTRTTERKP